jgi:hypothetical protein
MVTTAAAVLCIGAVLRLAPGAFLGWLSLARPSGSSLLLTQSEPAFRKGCLDILHCRLSVRPFASNQISDKLGMPILPGCIWA